MRFPVHKPSNRKDIFYQLFKYSPSTLVMCDPMSIAVTCMVIGTASSAFGFMQQSQQASATSKAIKENYAQRNEALKLQYDQTNKQATDEMSKRAKEAMIDSARLRAISGES